MPNQVNVTETTMIFSNVELNRTEAFCFKCSRDVPIDTNVKRTVESAKRACEGHFCKPTRLDCKKNAISSPTVCVSLPLTHGNTREFEEFKHMIEGKFPLIKQNKGESPIVPFNDRILAFMRSRESHFNANKKDIINENNELKERIRILEEELVRAVALKPSPVITPSPNVEEEAPTVCVELPTVTAEPSRKKRGIPKCRVNLRAAQAAHDVKEDEDSSDDEHIAPQTTRVSRVEVELPETTIDYCYTQIRECEGEHGEDEDGNAIDCDCDLSPNITNEDSICFREFMAFCNTNKGWVLKECETRCVPLWSRLVNTVQSDSDYNGRVNLAMMNRGETATIWDWCSEFMD
jgi:hypothetical protein